MEDWPPTMRDQGGLMDAMSGNVATVRSAPSLAGVRGAPGTSSKMSTAVPPDPHHSNGTTDLRISEGMRPHPPAREGAGVPAALPPDEPHAKSQAGGTTSAESHCMNEGTEADAPERQRSAQRRPELLADYGCRRRSTSTALAAAPAVSEAIKWGRPASGDPLRRVTRSGCASARVAAGCGGHGGGPAEQRCCPGPVSGSGPPRPPPSGSSPRAPQPPPSARPPGPPRSGS